VTIGVTSGSSVDAWFAESRAWAERELDRHLPAAATEPTRVHEAMRYAVFGGGKRLRPALVRLLGAHGGASDDACALPAVAIECVHTYSLVHDDLPCMDDDDLRRGRPTCHKVYGEALAVLAGDALLTHAFATLARVDHDAGAFVACLADAAGSVGMVGGQVLDLGLSAARASRDDVDRVHRLKTAALIASACEMGALAARASARDRAAAREYGFALGRCFQAVDDILDVTGDAATLGKTPGKDQRAEKPTLVAALGLDGARREAARLAEEARAAALALGGGPTGLSCRLVEELLVRRA